MQEQVKLIADLFLVKRAIVNRVIADVDFYRQYELLQRGKCIAGLEDVSLPKKTFNVNDILTDYEILKNSCLVVNALIQEEKGRIQSYLDSNQANQKEEADMLLELEWIKNAGRSIAIRHDAFDSKTAQFIEKRTFLPIYLPDFKTYCRTAEHIESNLYFLGNDHTLLNPLQPAQFSRYVLDQDEFECLSAAILAASTPQNLIELAQAFLSNAINVQRIAICEFEAGYEGFILYFDENCVTTADKIKEIAGSYPEHLEFMPDQKIWVLRMKDSSIMQSEFIHLFDAWIDTRMVTIYLKHDQFPVSTNTGIALPQIFLTDYIEGILFDYLPDAIAIHTDKVLSGLMDFGMKQMPRTVSFFDGKDFIKPDLGTAWTYHELLLVRGLVGEVHGVIAIYDTRQQKIISQMEYMGFLANECQKLFAFTIQLLKIKAVETVNPAVLLLGVKSNAI